MKKIIASFVALLSHREVRFLDRLLHQSILERHASYAEHLHYFYWENQTDLWGTLASPVRPSKGDVAVYERFLSRLPTKGRVLLLGSTPELRDLLAGLRDVKVHLADFSYRMPLAMLSYTANVDPAREIWIKANWLELPLPEGSFDAILGDLVLQQFPPELERSFLGTMARLLAPHGRFLGRFHFLHENMKTLTLEEIVSAVLDGKGDEEQKIVLLKLHTLWRYAEPERRKLNRDTSAREFERFVRASGLRNKIVERALASVLADRTSYRSWSPPAEDELERILTSAFRIEERALSSDYVDAAYYPLFLLARK